MVGRALAVAAGTLTLLIAASSAQAGPPAGATLEERRYSEAQALLDRAAAKVTRDSSCRARPGHRAPGLADEPSPRLLNTLAPLRRPAQPGELEGAPALLPPLAPAVYRDHVRLAHAADGTTLAIAPARNVLPVAPRPTHCISELRSRFLSAIAGRRPAFQRVARELLRGEIVRNWLARPREGVYLFTETEGVIGDLEMLRTRGVYLMRSGFEVADTTILGLLPDGVASVDFTFRRFEPTGYWSKHHPVTHRTTVAVQENVVGFHVPLTLRDASMARQVWRGSDGRVIRVVPGR